MTTFESGDRVVVESPVFTETAGSGLLELSAIGIDAVGSYGTVLSSALIDGDIEVDFPEHGPLWVAADGLLLVADLPELVEQREPEQTVEPLTAPLESTTSHDPYINARFIALMGHADNADVHRAFTVGLAINDPALPVDPEKAAHDPGVAEDAASKAPAQERGTARWVDKDRDVLHTAYSREGAHVFFKTSDAGFYLRVVDIPAFIIWLKAQETKHRGGPAGAGS